MENQILKSRYRKKGAPFEIENRNSSIKREYYFLRSQGMKKEAACEELSNKYFLSISRINSIIYAK
jgi:hypothetical protein